MLPAVGCREPDLDTNVLTCAGGEASLSLRVDDDVPYTGFSIKCSQSYERMPTQTQGSFRFWDTDDQVRLIDPRCIHILREWHLGPAF